jgi:hypothetical protein
MSSVQAAPVAAPASAPGPTFNRRPPPPRRPRNLPAAILGLLLVLFSATTVAVLLSRAGHRTPVLVMVRTVPTGASITSRDVAEAGVAADPSVHAIPASDLGRVIGRVAAVTLVRGTLVTNAELASGPPVAAGSSVVGLDVKPGFAPAGLRSGAVVRLVLSQPDATSSAPVPVPVGPPVLAKRASVFDVASTPDGQAQIVSVVVDDELAPAVAAAGARGEVSIILLGGPG